MPRCPVGSARIGRRLALKVLDWHGGSGEPSYAVGSSGLADHCVPKKIVFEAAMEFRRSLRDIEERKLRYTKAQKAELARLAERLRLKALPYEGAD